jgi:ATP-dependent DNA ligase
VVAKKAREPCRKDYRSWFKVKAYKTADLVVGGFTRSPTGRVSQLLGAHDDQVFIYVGRTGAVALGDATLRMLEQLFCEDSFAPWPTKPEPAGTAIVSITGSRSDRRFFARCPAPA